MRCFILKHISLFNFLNSHSLQDEKYVKGKKQTRKNHFFILIRQLLIGHNSDIGRKQTKAFPTKIIKSVIMNNLS